MPKATKEELEFWENIHSEYLILLKTFINRQHLCGVTNFESRWKNQEDRKLIIELAKEFLEATPKYSDIRVSGSVHLFTNDFHKREEVRIDFLNFIIQKLQCS